MKVLSAGKPAASSSVSELGLDGCPRGYNFQHWGHRWLPFDLPGSMPGTEGVPLEEWTCVGVQELGEMFEVHLLGINREDLFSSMLVKLFSAQGLGFRSLEK